MDLAQLANVGEFVGGIAVLITLVYVAVQVRQGAAAQQTATEIAAADAIQNSVNRWSAYRQMITDESTGTIWAKALHDEGLSPAEAVRFRAMLQELAYSAVATRDLWIATGQEGLLRGLPEYVSRELGNSETMRQAWAETTYEMRLFGWEDLAADVAQRLRGGATANDA